MINRREAIRTTALTGIALTALPRAVAHAAMLAGVSTNPRQGGLATKILADQNLPEVLRMARDLLSSGLNAGSGYQATWIRDMNTFIQIALGVNSPQRFREALLMFFKFQGPDGNIVDLYWPRDPGKPVNQSYRTSPTISCVAQATSADRPASWDRPLKCSKPGHNRTSGISFLA